jgi:GDP-4-dehydro-6-deoxy-D-mannose reductase
VRVLVTGATGFAGRHLLAELSRRGLSAIPTGIDVSTPAPESSQAPVASGLDLRDSEAIRGLVAEVRPDAVIHLAAQASAGASFGAQRETLEVNVGGTWNLLGALRDEAPAARLLVISSSDIYGPSTPESPHTETSPFDPRSPYGVSKAAQDLLAGIAGTAYRLPTIRIRPFPHAGPGQRTQFALPAFAAQVAAIERGEGEPVLRVGNLEVTRDYADVRDVVRAYADLLTRGEPGEAYNVCTGRGMLLRHLVERLVASARVPIRIDVDPTRLRPTDLPHLVGDPGKLKAATGWRPEIDIDQTLADLLEDARVQPAPGPLMASDRRESPPESESAKER